MYSLWISTCCFIVCLIIHHTPSSYCAAAAPTSSKPQHEQQPEHHLQTEIVDLKPPIEVSSDPQKLAEQSRNENTFEFTKGSRNKRELIEFRDEMNVAKRLRNFVGKRDRELDAGNVAAAPEYHGYPPFQVWFDTVDGKFYLSYPDDDESLLDKGTDDSSDEEIYGDIAKRLRGFVGKRGSIQFGVPGVGGWSPEDDQDLELNKRLRNFVGKRMRAFVSGQDDIDKRARNFVGKRLRNFVGKRDSEYDFGSEPFSYDKRPRNFVGKRVRSFVGTREKGLGYGDDWDTLDLPHPYTFDDGIDISADKRLRNFVGKRSMNDVVIAHNPPLSFARKREDKRLRGFVGKRSDELHDDLQFLDFGTSQPHKRPRSFLGKRDGLDTSAVERLMKSKRLRNFVGKRDSGVSKRLRSFLGRR